MLAPRALLKFVSSSLSAYCENTAGFLTVGHATIFCVSLQRLSLAIDKTQHVGVNLHVCGFKPTVGLQQRFPVAAQNAGDTREASL